MSDPVPGAPAAAPDPSPDGSRDARIEELLLTGLDHYFAGQYERAISVWTRIIFLDRHHDRARAYIERARSAVAERQRESEELFHEGVAAYNAGRFEEARTLLTQAVQQGSDGANLFLDRLDRVGPAPAAPWQRLTFRAPAGARSKPGAPAPAVRRRWTAVVAGGVGLAFVMLIGGLPIGTWLSEWQFGPAARSAPPSAEQPLPVVTPSEAALDAARALHASGKPRDALRVLDQIGAGDPARSAADQLRLDIQRELLEAAGLAEIPAEAPTRP